MLSLKREPAHSSSAVAEVAPRPRFLYGALGWATLGLVLLVLGVYAALYSSPAEDATILYQYSRNLAETGKISYDPALAPAEGATDFLWMVLLAGFDRVGIDPFVASVALTLVGAGALTLLIRRLLTPRQADSPLFPVGMAAVFVLTPFLYAGLRGFSVIVFSALILATLLCLASDRFNLGCVLGAITILLRPDGVVFVGTGLLIAWIQRRSLRDVLAGVLIVGLPFGIYWAWRSWYFGNLFPLPFYVKGYVERVFGLFHRLSLRDVGTVALASIPLVVGAGVALASRKHPDGRIRRRERALLLGAATVSLLFYASFSNEMNIGLRFEGPSFFLVVAWAVACGISPLVLLFSTIWMAAAFLPADKRVVKRFVLGGTEPPRVIARRLGELGKGLAVATEAGRLPYYSRWQVVDAWGLNTPKYSKRLIRTEEIVEMNPDLIVFRDDFSQFDFDLRRPAGQRTDVRTWHELAHRVYQAARYLDSEIWMVRDNDARFARNPVSRNFAEAWQDREKLSVFVTGYAIPADSRFGSEIRQILQSAGAIPLSEYRFAMEQQMRTEGGSESDELRQ